MTKTNYSTRGSSRGFFRWLQFAALVTLFALFNVNANAQVSLTASAGTASGSFTTLKLAFDAINAGTHQGAIVISINANTSETAPAVLNSTGAGSASYTSVLVQPTADGLTISGATATGRGLIELNGADNVTIDGDNPNTSGTNRNLTITNTAANTVTHTSCVRIAVAATVVTSANGNTISNLIVNGSATGLNASGTTSTTGVVNASYGIYAGGGASTVAATTAPSAITSVSTTVGTGATYNNLVISNNAVNACARAIYVGGSAAAVCNSLTISNNTIGAATPNSTTTVYSMGITAQGTASGLISGNTIRSVESWLATSIRGIDVGAISSVAGDVFTVSGNTVSNVVHRATTSLASYGAYGINIVGGTGNTIANNFIYGLNNCGSGLSTTFGCFGIRIGANTNHKVYHNSVNLSGTNLTALAAYQTACLAIVGTGQTGVDVRNNIFSNTSSANGQASSYATCIYLPTAGTSAMNLTLNNNVYYTGSTSGLHGVLSSGTTYVAPFTVANFNPALTTPATNSRSYTSTLSAAGTNDNASYASTTAAPFTSSTNLLLNTSSAETITRIWNKGATGTGVTTDIQGEARPQGVATNPTIGADEVLIAVCTVADGGTITPSTANSCVGSTYTMSTTGSTSGAGITYQWEVSTTGGGVGFANVSGGSGATTNSYTTGALAAGTYYYRLNVTCSNGPITGYSNELTITVNAVPTVAVTPNTGSICSPGGSAVALTASGASTYAWSPAGGLSATTGANVSANPTSTTTYTVTGTDGNGCTNTATAAITVSSSISLSATATPANVCSGNNSQLNVVVNPAVATATNTIKITEVCINRGGTGGGVYPAFAPGADLIEITNISSSPVDISGWALEDYASNSATVTHTGFTFPASTIIPANSVAVVCLGTGTNDVANRYYNTGGTSDFWLSSALVGIVLKNGATVVDAVGCGSGYVFNAGSGVVATDWSGFAPSASGLAGTTRSAALDNNIGADWIAASAGTPQTIGVYNAGYTAPISISTYAWSPVDFLSSTSIVNPVATAVTAATTYTVIATTTGGCSASTTVSVGIATGSPTVAVTPAGPVNLCGSATQVLTAAASGGGAPYSYAWTLNGSPIGGNTATLTASAAGTYEVTVTDFCSQTGTSNSVVVNVFANPTATATATSSVCAGGNISLNVTTPTGTSFAWTGPNAYTSSSQNPTITGVTTAAAGVYSVVVTGPGGCTVSASTAAVVVNAAPTGVTASATPLTVCNGSPINLSSSYSSSGVSGLNNYTATRTTGISYTSIAPGTQVTSWRNALSTDDNLSDNQPIGFSFIYNGTPYTDFRVSTNGFLTFNTTSTATGSGTGAYGYSNSWPVASGGLMVAPNWDDLQTAGNLGTLADLNNSINYTTSGSAPNRVLTVEWINMQDFSSTSTASYNWQVKLYESDSHIEFVYGTMTQSAASVSYSLGLSAATVSATPLAAELLSQTTVNTGTFGFTNQNSLTPVAASNSMISFAAPAGTTSWSGPNSFISSIANPTATASTSGAYTVTITNPSNGCTTSATTATVNVTTITVSSTPTSPLCNGGSDGSATFSASGGVGPYTFTFNGSPAISPVTGLAAGTYAIVATDANGCTGSGSVTIAPTSAVVVSGAQSVAPTCYNSADGAITFSATGGTAGYTFTLNGSPATSPATGLAAGNYNVVATDANGCTGLTGITVTAPAAPTVTASNDGPVCEGATITLSATAGFTSYAWTGPVNGSGNPYAISSAVPANSGSYSVVATDADGCTATGSTSIVVNPSEPAAVTVTVSPSLSVCVGSSVTFTANPTNGGASPSYQWYLNTVLLTGETNPTYVTSSLAIGNNDVYVVMTSNAACATGSPATAPTVTVNVSGSVAASVSLTGNSAVCAGSSATYTATPTAGGATPTYDFYLVGNPTPVQTGSSNTYTFTPVATSDIYVIMTSSFACATGSPATSNTVNTVYNTLPATPLVTPVGPTTICEPGTVTLVSSYTGSGNTWNPGGATTDQVVISAVGAANYTVTYTDGNGCSSTSAPQAIAVYAANTVSITPASPSFCIGGSVVLTSSNALGNVWSPTTETTQSITVNTAGSYSVINTNENGCTATASVNVVENDFPVGSVTGSNTLCFGTSNLLTATYTVGSGTLSYAWSLNGTPISGANSSTYSANAVGSYTVVVTSSTGCSVTSDAFVIAGSGPLSGTYTIGSPASCTQFTSIANFVAQFNTVGVAGPVILDVPAGYTETAPVGGFSLDQCALGAGLRTSATNTLTIQKSGAGANPVLTGAVGTTTTSDGIFFIVGSDYVTIDGINVQESAANLTATTQNEFGYALVKCDGTNGAQNNTIKNCSVTLNRTNVGTIGIFSASVTKAGVAVVVTATSGGNSNNTFISNTVSNAYWGIYVGGFADAVAPYTFFDQNNTIGTVSQGNTISTFGRGTAAATDIAIGIYTEFNNGIQIRGNTITASGHTGSAEGIRTGSARWANVDITNNTISGTTAGAAGAGYNFGILNLSGNRANRLDAVTNTVNITNNTIQNLTIPAVTTGDVRGIIINKFAADSMSAVTVNISNNSYLNNTNPSTASASGFANIGVLCQVAANTLTVNQNTFTNNRLTGGAAASNRMIVVGTPGNTPNWNATFNITNNDISSTNVATALGAVVTGIAFENYAGNSMASGTINITGNSLNGITQLGNVTGTMTGITATVNTNLAGLPSQTLNLSNNVVTNISRGSSTTGVLTAITNTGSPLALNVTGNQVTNNSTGAAATGTTHAFNGILLAGTTLGTVSTITNNIVTGNTHNGTGTTTLLSCGLATTQTISGNTISNNQKTTIPASTTATTMSCLVNSTASYTLSNNTVSNNRILGASGTGVCTINGIINAGGPASETLSNNNVNTLFVAGSSAGFGTIFGIRHNTGTVNTRILENNQVYNLYTTSAIGTIRAIRSELGGTVTIRKNKIYDIYPAGATATAVGISLSNGTVTNVQNNYVGLDQTGLVTAIYTGSNAVIGLEVANTTNTQVVNAFFNTIRLAGAPGSGTLFGSSGISVTSTTPAILDLRNNIVVNLMTPGGASPGFAVAYRRANVLSSGNYGALSNNNLLYAGATGTTRLIYFDGTNSDQTIAAFKARGAALSPVRDANSVTENVNFASLVGTATGPTGFLHISTATPTVIESGGQAIATITDDYDGDVRNVSTPDIGADENGFINDALIISSLTAFPSTTASCTNVARVITATYSLGTGAPAILSSTLNYTLNGGAVNTVTMTQLTPTVWQGTIPTVIPANATVAYTVTGFDGVNTSTATGVSYKDEPFIAAAITAVATPATICAGSQSTINLTSSQIATYSLPPAVANPTTDEDLGRVVITQGANTILDNTTPGGSLVGTIGTGTGTGGSYSDFTAFGPYTLNAGTLYNFALTSITQGGIFGNSMAIYIDYNRNGVFTDAGELAYAAGTTISGPHTETGSFTVPVSANNGLARMRVICNEGTITSPTQAISWGEYEEYRVNIVNPSNTNFGGLALSSISWSDGVSTVGSTASITQSPAATTTYTATLTSAAGCTSQVSATVTVNPVPAAPFVLPSFQCGAGVPTAQAISASGLLTPAFNWYLAPTGGTPVQSSTSDVLTTYSITATTTFYVSEINTLTGCESGRTSVIATVIQPDVVTANTSAASICLGQSFDLSITQAGSNQNYSFTWTGTANSGVTSIPGAPVTGLLAGVTPTAAGTYTYTVTAVDGPCTYVNTINVLVKANPAITSVTANPAGAVCAGTTVTLTGTNIVSGPQTQPSGYPGYSNSFPSTADEQIFGVTFGSLSNIQSETCSSNYTDYTSSIPATTIQTGQVIPFSVRQNECDQGTLYANGLSIYIDWNRDGDWLDAGEQVFTTTTTSAATGVSPGGDNVRSGNITVPPTASVGVTRMRVIIAEGVISPSSTEAFTYGEQEDYLLNIETPGPALNWSWNNGGGAGASVTVNPTTTTTYTATATDPATTCSSTASLTVTVNPIPSAPTSAGSTQCGAGIPTAAVASATSGVAFNWYLAPTGGTPIQSSTSATLTAYTITTGTTFYVSAIDLATSCESARTPVSVIVNIPDVVTASSSAATICLGQSFDLTATQTGSTNTYVYTWNGTANSGLTTATGSSVTGVTPTAAGSYTYTNTAVDAGLGCTFISTVTVTVSANPAITSVTASPAGAVCAGTSVTLTGTNFISGPQTQPSGYPGYSNAFPSDADEQIFGVTFGTMSNIQTETCVGNYADYTSSIPAPTIQPGQIVPFTVRQNECDQGTLYANGLSIFIDWNRNGVWTDPGEQVFTTTATTAATGVSPGGDNVRSGNILVPLTASVGVTRMRVIMAEGVISPSSVEAFTFGEQEDYIVNVEVPGPALNWSWDNGGGTGASVTVAPTTTTTYTTTATNAAGCTATSFITVNVNPLPSAPTATPSAQCGVGIPTATVASTSGALTPAFNWYLTPSGGSPVQSSTATSLSTYSISTTTSFFVAEVNPSTNCESPRTTVTVTVNQPDVVTANTSAATICLGQSFNLSLTQIGSTNTYAFTWNGTASPTSGLATATTSSVTGVTPTAAGTYIYTLTAVDATLGCTFVTTVSVTVNPLPTIFAATASASSVCAGTSVTLSAFAGSNIPAPTTYCATTNAGSSAITNVTINTLNRTSGAIPLTPFYESVPEATATTSLVPGTSYPISITTDASAIVSVWIDFNRDGVYAASEWVQPFTSGISGTSTFLVPITASSGKTGMRVRSRAVGNINGDIDACTIFGSGETEDYTVTILSTSGGTFTWTDGTSTISSSNPYTFTPAASGTYFAVLTGANGCSSTSAAVPVTVISTPSAPIVSASTSTICVTGTSTLTITNPVSGVTYQWAESTTIGGTYTPILGANGTSFTTPTLTATNYYNVTASCGANSATSAPTGIIVSSPIVSSSTGATRCGNGLVTITASGTGDFNWYNVPSGGTILFTGASYSPIVSATTTFYVEAFDGTCFNIAQGRVPVSVIVTPSTAVTLSATPTTVCFGTSVSISAASTNPNYTYSWTWNGGGSASGASFTITPTLTRYYVVTAVDGACQFIDSILVTVNQLPTIGAVTATPASGCVGLTTQLSAGASENTSAPAPTTYCAATNQGSSVITNVTFNTINSSGNISVGPSFYTSVPEATATTTLLKGQTYSFNLTLDGTGIASVWIDYNRDGVYDASEWQQVFTAAASGVISITIPGTAGSGKTGMRVRSRLSGNANGSGDACLAMGSGETEDYIVTLASPLTYAWTPATGLSSATIANPTATFVLGSTTYNVVVTNTSTGCFTAPTPVTITGTNGPNPVITDVAGNPVTNLTLCDPNFIDLYVRDGNSNGGVAPFSAYSPAIDANWPGRTPGAYESTDNSYPSNNGGSTFNVTVRDAGGCLGTAAPATVITRSVTVTSNITDASCVGNNGAITVTVSSAPTAPYTYVWTGPSGYTNTTVATASLTNTISGLAAGVYTLDIFDNVGGALSCSSTGLQFTVGSSAITAVNFTNISNNACFGNAAGAATAVPVGGTAPYTYLWSPNAASATTATVSGLGGGTYTVTVTDNSGCSFTNSVTITEPAEIVATVSTVNACFGQSNGSASVTITGGSGIYTTTDWYNVDFSLLYGSGLSVTSLPAGTLNLVIVDDAGCSPVPAVLNPVINETPAITVSSFAPTSGAVGTSVVITGSGFTGATSVSFNGTAAITYTVDNDLQITATVPAGATTGLITVNVGQCSGVSGGNFTVISTGTLNLKAYIQGYLDVLTTTMAPVMSNQTGSLDLTEVDNITVEFHDATAPYALAATSTVMLYTNGTATVTIPGSLIGGSYYIAIKHRSAIETWSANPVSLTTVTAYDFTTSSSQAFGDNMVEGPTGVWSLYTGDVDNTLATATQDGLIDLSDFLLLDIDVQNFTGGYVATDLNGNGLVDLDDFLIQDANVQNFISTLKP